MNKEKISKSVIKLILNTCIIKKRIYKGKRIDIYKRLLVSYPKCILGWAGDNWPGKRREKRKDKKSGRG